MKYPKILPWLARKAGVSDERAGELWAEAIRHATARTGWVGTSEYWRVAVARLVELLEAESRQARSCGLSPWVRAQARIGLASLVTWQALTLIGYRTWLRLAAGRQLA